MKKKFILAFLIMAFIIPSVDFAFAENKRDDNHSTTTTAVTSGDVDPDGTVACADITRNLRYGSKDTETNSDVSMLQDFLIERGYMKGNTTGFFGKGTFTGVRAFQKAQNITATGFVGSVTRGKIKAIDCTGEIIIDKNEDGNKTKREIIRKIYDANKLGQIFECSNNGNGTIYIAYENANVGGGTIHTYNKNGIEIKREDTPNSTNQTPMVDTTTCKVIYLATPNMQNKPGVDVYNVAKPTGDPATAGIITFGQPIRLYKDRIYTIDDINYTLTITGFYNHPCPQGSMCIWSGLDIFYKLSPKDGKGPSYVKSEINQNTDSFPFNIAIKDSDYTNFAEVVINMRGQNTHIIDSLPGSGDNH